MTGDDLRMLCLSLPETDEGFPFGPEVLIFKVAGKMFATLAIDAIPQASNLKCDPERAVLLRDEHEGIAPGWHMNKKHWNTITLDGSVPTELVDELVRHSYELVVGGLKKVDRERVRAAYAEMQAAESN